MALKDNRRVLIRADGNKRIGLGHLSRAGLTAKMLKERFGLDVVLVVKEDAAADRFLAGRINGKRVLPEAISLNEEKDALKKIVSEIDPSLVIVDVLENDVEPSYLDSLKISGCPLVAITDDSAKRVINADVVVNGNPNQVGLDYSGASGRYFIGPQYFLMDGIYEGMKVKRPNGKVERVLLSFGGSDHNDLLFKVLDAFSGLAGFQELMIITSKATGYWDKLTTRLSDYPKKTELIADVPSLAPYWTKCDLAVTAGGNTLFERVAARLPGATVCQLARQMEIADRFDQMGVNKNLGFGLRLTVKELQSKLSEFLLDGANHIAQYENAPNAIDGKGMDRLGNIVEALLNGREP